MAKNIPLEGQNDRGDTKFEKAEDTGTQINIYVGEKAEGSKHCHLYKERDTGKTGVEHRGSCCVCDDKIQNNAIPSLPPPNSSSDSSDSDSGSDSGSSGK